MRLWGWVEGGLKAHGFHCRTDQSPMLNDSWGEMKFDSCGGGATLLCLAFSVNAAIWLFFFFYVVVFWFFWGRVSLYVHILSKFAKNCRNVNRTRNKSVLNKRSGCWCHTPANKGRRVWLWQCWELAGVWGCVRGGALWVSPPEKPWTTSYPSPSNTLYIIKMRLAA